VPPGPGRAEARPYNTVRDSKGEAKKKPQVQKARLSYRSSRIGECRQKGLSSLIEL
jgi:hypothetical protein